MSRLVNESSLRSKVPKLNLPRTQHPPGPNVSPRPKDVPRTQTRVHENQHYDESLDVVDSEEVASIYTPTPRAPHLKAHPGTTMARLHDNQPYDESLEVDGEEVASVYAHTPAPNQQFERRPSSATPTDRLDLERGVSRGDTPPRSNMSDDASDEDFDDEQSEKKLGGLNPGGNSAGGGGQEKMYDDSDDDSEDESSDDDDETGGGAVEGAYDPTEYDHLAVSSEIKELFQYITRYTPQSIELDHKLKPFIPDFIPAVGDIDAFLKVPRPDGKNDMLGLTLLDEPCAKQSDPTVLDIQLRNISKTAHVTSVRVRSLQGSENTPKAIDNWIQSINEIHRSKPPPNVHYNKTMPEVESLMQEWPAEFEELLKEIGLPTADMDCDLSTYVQIICGILDIPIYKSKVQSLHVLFSLYSEFKNSHHFRSLAAENRLDNALKGQSSAPGDNADQLVL